MAEHRDDGRPARALVVPTDVTLGSTAPTTPQDDPEASATVKEAMATMTVPASDAIFAAASDPPRDDESSALLMTGDRIRDNTAWVEMARGLVNQALAALKAAEARNSDALSKGERLTTT